MIGRRYLGVRVADPWAPPQVDGDVDRDAGALLAVLQQLAADNEPLPTLQTLGVHAGLSLLASGRALQRLEAVELVRVRAFGARGRAILLVETGWEVRSPLPFDDRHC